MHWNLRLQCIGDQVIVWPGYKGICLESRHALLRISHASSADFTFSLNKWAQVQPATVDPILDLCTRYAQEDRGSVEYEVCLTPLHIISTDNWTHDPLIFELSALSTHSYAITGHGNDVYDFKSALQ